MTEKRRTTTEEAKRVGDATGGHWTRFDLEQFPACTEVEFATGIHDSRKRLEEMEGGAERDWAGES